MDERISHLLAVGNVAEVRVGCSRSEAYQSTAAEPAAFREAAIHAAAEAMGLPMPKVWSGQEIGGRWRSVDRVKQASFAEQKLNNATLWGRHR